MPEFVLELGTPQAARKFAELDAFTQGYIEAMFFTNCSTPEDDKLSSATVADLAAETLARIVKDCEQFQTANADLIQRACDHDFRYTETNAGRDFWYTRCGHGVGFWDRGLGEIGDALSKAATACGNVDMYAGDGGRVYLA